MCAKSTRLCCRPVAVLAFIALAMALADAAALPTNQRAASSRVNAASPMRSGENGLRHAHHQSQPSRPLSWHSENKHKLCGSKLTAKIANVCKGSYNQLFQRASYVRNAGFKSVPATTYVGAADQCCQLGCTDWEICGFCGDYNDCTNSLKEENTSDMITSSIEGSVQSSNQLRTDPVVQEEPRSVSLPRKGQGSTDRSETKIGYHDYVRNTTHRYEIKKNGPIYTNRPLVPRKQNGDAVSSKSVKTSSVRYTK